MVHAWYLLVDLSSNWRALNVPKLVLIVQKVQLLTCFTICRLFSGAKLALMYAALKSTSDIFGIVTSGILTCEALPGSNWRMVGTMLT